MEVGQFVRANSLGIGLLAFVLLVVWALIVADGSNQPRRTDDGAVGSDRASITAPTRTVGQDLAVPVDESSQTKSLPEGVILKDERPKEDDLRRTAPWVDLIDIIATYNENEVRADRHGFGAVVWTTICVKRVSRDGDMIHIAVDTDRLWQESCEEKGTPHLVDDESAKMKALGFTDVLCKTRNADWSAGLRTGDLVDVTAIIAGKHYGDIVLVKAEPHHR